MNDTRTDLDVKRNLFLAQNEPMNYLLLAYAPDGTVADDMWTLEKEITVGRVHDCDVLLKDNKVSRRHFKIVNGRRKHKIVDLDSSNGTFVNGKRITKASRGNKNR
jgi:predicted component of type VI protein secretion system